MIQNPRVLEDTFVPREVEHRNDEMNALTSALTPITDGRSALPTFLVGPSGAGKTCLAHVALDRLREAVAVIEPIHRPHPSAVMLGHSTPP